MIRWIEIRFYPIQTESTLYNGRIAQNLLHGDETDDERETIFYRQKNRHRRIDHGQQHQERRVETVQYLLQFHPKAYRRR